MKLVRFTTMRSTWRDGENVAEEHDTYIDAERIVACFGVPDDEGNNTIVLIRATTVDGVYEMPIAQTAHAAAIILEHVMQGD